MSHPMISRSNDLKRLQEEGYALRIQEGCLVVEDIPFAEAGRIERGAIVCSLETDGESTTRPGDHTVWWSGGRPDAAEMGLRTDGVCGEAQPGTTMAGREVRFQLSIRPSRDGVQTEAYEDYYEKIETYAQFLSRGARRVDQESTPKRYKIVAEIYEDSRFVYRDGTAEVRGVNELNRKLEDEKVAIIGAGGTGSHILDYVAKTPVKEINIYDGDRMKAHNGYRIPGTIEMGDLKRRPYKAEWLAERYKALKRGVQGHGEVVGTPLPGGVAEASFVFISIDNPVAKKEIVKELLDRRIPFVHVGMAVQIQQDDEGKVFGQPAMVTSLITPEDQWTIEDIQKRINLREGKENQQELYGRNIQMAELNAMNAGFAVIQWKKYRGVYRDEWGVRDSIYDVGLQMLTKKGERNAA